MCNYPLSTGRYSSGMKVKINVIRFFGAADDGAGGRPRSSPRGRLRGEQDGRRGGGSDATMQRSCMTDDCPTPQTVRQRSPSRTEPDSVTLRPAKPRLLGAAERAGWT